MLDVCWVSFDQLYDVPSLTQPWSWERAASSSSACCWQSSQDRQPRESSSEAPKHDRGGMGIGQGSYSGIENQMAPRGTAWDFLSQGFCWFMVDPGMSSLVRLPLPKDLRRAGS